MELRYIYKYLTMAPVMATLIAIAIAVIFIQLNYIFPGLQYGTFLSSFTFSRSKCWNLIFAGIFKNFERFIVVLKQRNLNIKSTLNMPKL
ncbi:MAG: hypothetical protein HC894_15440 [Microcoleus sp. SM1_3_4]|nr:hypothetical protein [Microcoleus sp. SM1_3_4]